MVLCANVTANGSNPIVLIGLLGKMILLPTLYLSAICSRRLFSSGASPFTSSGLMPNLPFVE